MWNTRRIQKSAASLLLPLTTKIEKEIVNHFNKADETTLNQRTMDEDTQKFDMVYFNTSVKLKALCTSSDNFFYLVQRHAKIERTRE